MDEKNIENQEAEQASTYVDENTPASSSNTATSNIGLDNGIENFENARSSHSFGTLPKNRMLNNSDRLGGIKKSLNPNNLNKIGNGTKNFSKFTPSLGSMVGDSNSDNEMGDDDTSSDETETQKLKGKGIFGDKFIRNTFIGFIFSGVGCFSFIIIIIVVIFSIYIMPIMYVGQAIRNTIDDINEVFVSCLNWIKRGTYCSNEKECQEIEKNDFYEKVIEVHDEYKEKYNVELNSELITATLTYQDVVLTGFDSLENINSNINFKKSEKKVRDLAEHMVSNNSKCVNKETGDITDLVDNKCANGYTAVKKYSLDEEKYKKYLQDEFIKTYYFSGQSSDEIDEKITRMIDDIYERAKISNYLNGYDNSSNNFIGNNVNVSIMDCTGNIELEQVSLYEYLQGVLYYEGFATNRSEEFLKVMAIASKNYLYSINGATENNIPTTLRVRNCRQNQIYCSVEDGCYNMMDSEDENKQTIASGTDFNNAYHRPPVSDMEVLEKIKNAIDSTYDDFIIDDTKFVYSQYRSDCQSKGLVCDSTTNIMDQTIANNMVNSGSTYQDVIATFYQGEIKKISLSIVGYPLDLKFNYITSAFGWRVHPIYGDCRTHTGTDIAATQESNIYSIADGVVVENTSCGVESHTCYGYYTIIGHGIYNSDTNTYEYYSLYAHQVRHSTLINEGDIVKAGQKIGSVGSTGASTGPHLHIEIYKKINGKKVGEDPVSYFDNIELEGNVGGALYPSKEACLAARK